MKIKELIIDNFRAYNTMENKPFSLIIEDKPIVLIYGNNGLGKSSLYDAIEWGLTGKIERYNAPSAEKNDYYILKNHFSKREEGYVEIKFDDNFRIKRTLKQRGKSDYNIGKLENGLKKNNILEYLVEEEYRDKIEINKHFNVSHLLSQELLSSFIKETNEGERYKTFLSLYGLNNDNNQKIQIDKKISDIKKLEKKATQDIGNINSNLLGLKNKLKKNSNNDERIRLEREFKEHFKNKEIKLEILNSLDEEFKIIKNEILGFLQTLNSQKDILLKKEKFEEDNKEIFKIKKNVGKLLEIIETLKNYKIIKAIDKNQEEYCSYVELVKEESIKKTQQTFINSGIKKLENIKSDLEVVNHYKEHDEDEVKEYFKKIKLIKSLKEEIEDKKEEVKKISKVRESFLATSIELLNNIEYAKCPVCKKGEFNQRDAEKKLKEDLKNNVDPLIIKKKDKIERLKGELKELSNKNINIIKTFKKKLEKKLEESFGKKRALEEYFEKLALLKPSYEKVETSLEELNISFEGFEHRKLELEKVLKGNTETIITATGKIKLGEKELSKKNTEDLKFFNKLKEEKINFEKLEREIENKNTELKPIVIILENISKLITIYEDNNVFKEINNKKLDETKLRIEIKQLDKSINDLEELKEYLDEKILDKVEEKSKQYDKKIQYLYKMLSPHKYFNNIQIKVAERKGNIGNVLRIEIYDEKNKEITNNPAYIFSSAQTNILAISIFLTFALDSKWSKLDTILLDDPIQNIDDINIYAFTDLIKIVSEKKQVILSTHDDRIKNFMLKKFGEKNVQVVNFESYGKLAD